MPCVRIGKGRSAAIVMVAGSYKPGDMPPEGYIDRQEWAAVQMKAGLKQRECGRCGRWCFPQQFSAEVLRTPARRRDGTPVIVTDPLCLACADTAR